MPVLDRGALEESPLADIHSIASELAIDGYRRLRREALIDAIIERQGGAASKPARRPRRSSAKTEAAETDATDATAETAETAATDDKPEKVDKPARGAKADKPDKPARSPRADRSARTEKASQDSTQDEPSPRAAREPAKDEADETDEAEQSRRRRGRRGGRGRSEARPDARPDARTNGSTEEPDSREAEDEPVVEGMVELLANGSGFVRVDPPDPSDEDVYISAAQVKRCELVSGDRVGGPRRTPRRSERFASLVRIDTINGRPASELADGARYDELPAAFPMQRFRLGSEDPTVKAIEFLTPFGRGSRVTIVGAARSGKSEALRRLVDALVGDEELQLHVVLAGVRPEEIPGWSDEKLTPAAAISLAASADAQDHAVELVIDQARRIAARGAHAVVLIDTLDGLHPHSARKAIAAARNIVDGGSLTVIATATAPIGGETTVIALNAALTSTGRFPAIDLGGSGTIRPELLVGEAGAEAIAAARAEALDS
ncbi:MAG: Rho termination factor N-terminal domain-containing protein [Actinomycetota bacterium]|nr:Rho termination factor N-terminal domain-containing protein [Actinomycetota bacterium]